MKRVAQGLAIWAEMPAASVGVRKEGPGWGLETGSQPSPDTGLESLALGAAGLEWKPRAPVGRMYQVFLRGVVQVTEGESGSWQLCLGLTPSSHV